MSLTNVPAWVALVGSVLLLPTPAPRQALSLAVIVTDSDGNLPARGGLQADDFAVVVNGRSVDTLSVRESGQPVSWVALTDVSGSFYYSGRAPNTYTRAIDEELIGDLRDGDQGRVGTISRRILIQPEFSRSAPDLRKTIGSVFDISDADRMGPSPIWDALYEAAVHVEGAANQRAIILFTDGAATGNRRSADEAILRAARADAAVYVIAHGTEARLAATAARRGDRYEGSATRMQSAAEATGGLYMTDGLTDSWQRPRPGPLLRTALDSLRQRYVIDFAVPSGGQLITSVEISLRDPALHAHYRRLFD